MSIFHSVSQKNIVFKNIQSFDHFFCPFVSMTSEILEKGQIYIFEM